MHIERKLEMIADSKNKNARHSKEDVKMLIEYWNENKNVRKCKGTDTQIRNVLSRMNRYSVDEFKKYIDRYSIIISDKEYFFKYKWSFEVFVTHRETIERFDDEGTLWIAYQDWKENKSNAKNVIKKDVVESIDPVFEFVEGYDDVLKTLKNMDYTKYLLTEHWKHFSKQARNFYHNKCQLCDASHVPLHVHHKTYTNRGRETFADVIVLCDKCHRHTHSMPKE